MHGKTSLVMHDGTGLFAGVPSPTQVMRSHSLIAEPESLPAVLQVQAVAADDASEVHAVRHATHPVWGVQFHPESVMTPHGKDLLANFLGLAGIAAAANA
jgi:anthranilate/para-aminobenzoate synthase component II